MSDAYQFNANSLNNPHYVVGVWLLMQTIDRCRAVGLHLTPRPLVDACWVDWGYCLDAPDTMPAGGCAWCSVPPIDDDDPPPHGFPEQMTAERPAR